MLTEFSPNSAGFFFGIHHGVCLAVCRSQIIIGGSITALSGRDPATDPDSFGSGQFMFIVAGIVDHLQRLQGSLTLYFHQPQGFTDINTH